MAINYEKITELTGKLHDAEAKKADIIRRFPGIESGPQATANPADQAAFDDARRMLIGLNSDIANWTVDRESYGRAAVQASTPVAPAHASVPAAVVAPQPTVTAPPAAQVATPAQQTPQPAREPRWHTHGLLGKLIKWGTIAIFAILILWVGRMALERWDEPLAHRVNNGIQTVENTVHSVANDLVNFLDGIINEPPKSTETPKSDTCHTDPAVCDWYENYDLRGCDRLIVPTDKVAYVVFKREGEADFSASILRAGTYNVTWSDLDTESSYTLITATDGILESVVRRPEYIRPTNREVTAIFVQVDSTAQSSAPDLGLLHSPAP